MSCVRFWEHNLTLFWIDWSLEFTLVELYYIILFVGFASKFLLFFTFWAHVFQYYLQTMAIGQNLNYKYSVGIKPNGNLFWFHLKNLTILSVHILQFCWYHPFLIHSWRKDLFNFPILNWWTIVHCLGRLLFRFPNAF